MNNLVCADDRLAITDLMHNFFWLVDAGRASETVPLFAEDASITFGLGSPAPGTIGSEAISRAMIAREAQKQVSTRHVMSNLRFSCGDDGVVMLCSLLTLYRSDDAKTTQTVIADIEETYIKQGDIWQIKSRLVSPVFNL